MLRSRIKLRNLVPHPRYGTTITPSGTEVDPEVVRSSFWRYSSETIFPETAIPAEISRQDYSIYPRGYYVDILKECRDCKRRFIFFALEQKYWYEELGFSIDADCVRCAECRRDEHVIRATFERYSQNVTRRDMANRELALHIEDLCTLLDAGLVKNREKVAWVVAAARKRLADPALLARLAASLKGARADSRS